MGAAERGPAASQMIDAAEATLKGQVVSALQVGSPRRLRRLSCKRILTRKLDVSLCSLSTLKVIHTGCFSPH